MDKGEEGCPGPTRGVEQSSIRKMRHASAWRAMTRRATCHSLGTLTHVKDARLWRMCDIALSILTLILIVTTVYTSRVNAAATSGSLFYNVAFTLATFFSCCFVCVVKTLWQSTTLKLQESAWFHRRSLVSLLPRGLLLIRWRRAVRVEHRATSDLVQPTRLNGRTRQLWKVATTLSRWIFRRILSFTRTKNDRDVQWSRLILICYYMYTSPAIWLFISRTLELSSRGGKDRCPADFTPETKGYPSGRATENSISWILSNENRLLSNLRRKFSGIGYTKKIGVYGLTFYC